eukprot:7697856-Lingulodinium_polyedra.AAC.1
MSAQGVLKVRARSDQGLPEARSSFVLAMFKLYPSLSQVPLERCLSSVWVLLKLCPSVAQVLLKFCASSAQ